MTKKLESYDAKEVVFAISMYIFVFHVCDGPGVTETLSTER